MSNRFPQTSTNYKHQMSIGHRWNPAGEKETRRESTKVTSRSIRWDLINCVDEWATQLITCHENNDEGDCVYWLICHVNHDRDSGAVAERFRSEKKRHTHTCAHNPDQERVETIGFSKWNWQDHDFWIRFQSFRTEIELRKLRARVHNVEVKKKPLFLWEIASMCDWSIEVMPCPAASPVIMFYNQISSSPANRRIPKFSMVNVFIKWLLTILEI